MPADVTIMTDVEVATRDYGGYGQDVLLLHGGGRSMDDWRLVAPLLVAAGRSGHAPWRWQNAIVDVGAVVDQLGLVRPAIVGHSLGGMVAALWATSQDDCRWRSTSMGMAARGGQTGCDLSRAAPPVSTVEGRNGSIVMPLHPI
jgi:pimeloyl-ACP methyl ester carboxylesterase